MKELMHCVCGFSTNSGNKMAGHLGIFDSNNIDVDNKLLNYSKKRLHISISKFRGGKESQGW